jgi:hypothetical protein
MVTFVLWCPKAIDLSLTSLVGGFKHFLVSIIYGMSSFPLTNSYFSRWLLHHQPVVDDFQIGVRKNHSYTARIQQFKWSLLKRFFPVAAVSSNEWGIENNTYRVTNSTNSITLKKAVKWLGELTIEKSTIHQLDPKHTQVDVEYQF